MLVILPISRHRRNQRSLETSFILFNFSSTRCPPPSHTYIFCIPVHNLPGQPPRTLHYFSETFPPPTRDFPGLSKDFPVLSKNFPVLSRTFHYSLKTFQYPPETIQYSTQAFQYFLFFRVVHADTELPFSTIQ